MSWFRLHYHCESCRGSWLAEGELVIEADCLYCESRDVHPYKSDDRSATVEPHEKLLVVLDAMKRPARQKRTAPRVKTPAPIRKAS